MDSVFGYKVFMGTPAHFSFNLEHVLVKERTGYILDKYPVLCKQGLHFYENISDLSIYSMVLYEMFQKYDPNKTVNLYRVIATGKDIICNLQHKIYSSYRSKAVTNKLFVVDRLPDALLIDVCRLHSYEQLLKHYSDYMWTDKNKAAWEYYLNTRSVEFVNL